MSPPLKIWILGLLAVMVISACAPVVAPPSAAPEPPAATDAPLDMSTATAQPTSAPGAASATQTATQPPVPVATSRGDALEATDPSTVNLASGGIQLVEFFRFT